MVEMSKPTTVAAVATAALVIALLRRAKRKAPAASPSDLQRQPSSGGKDKIAINRLFFQRLAKLWKICLPRFVSAETLLMVTLGVLLYLRTNLTLVMSGVVGGNAKSLVNRDLKAFIFGVADIGFWAVPSSMVNSGIRYITSLLEQRFRAIFSCTCISNTSRTTMRTLSPLRASRLLTTQTTG